MDDIEIKITFSDNLTGCEIIRDGKTAIWEELSEVEKVKICNALGTHWQLMYNTI